MNSYLFYLFFVVKKTTLFNQFKSKVVSFNLGQYD